MEKRQVKQGAYHKLWDLRLNRDKPMVCLVDIVVAHYEALIISALHRSGFDEKTAYARKQIPLCSAKYLGNMFAACTRLPVTNFVLCPHLPYLSLIKSLSNPPSLHSRLSRGLTLVLLVREQPWLLNKRLYDL
ncbi:hypothetical protein ACU8KH_05318 [Lachancea thermotolerans]